VVRRLIRGGREAELLDYGRVDEGGDGDDVAGVAGEDGQAERGERLTDVLAPAATAAG
jgi:hypothetical protein